ncbi:hypothetical protein FRC11_009490 [Ceratobasidium sp. 423]|nr:hypothetical protein FRC11_009490 [Ceratobasidium sp. 423]
MSYRASCVRALFMLPTHLSFFYSGQLTYIQLFTPFDAHTSPYTKLHSTRPDFNSRGLRWTLVIPISDIVFACHLVPKFHMLDPELELHAHTDLLADSRYFWLNHYYNHHFYRLIQHWQRRRPGLQERLQNLQRIRPALVTVILCAHYDSLEYTEEAFSSILHMDKDLDKTDEIFFHLGIIYKQQPAMATPAAHTALAMTSVIPHPTTQLPALQKLAQANEQTWLLIGTVAEQMNDLDRVLATIGVLYYNTNQTSDTIDAYARAAELDPSNPHTTQRPNLLRNVQANCGTIPVAPGTQDIHPATYAGGGPMSSIHTPVGPLPPLTSSVVPAPLAPPPHPP